VARDVAKKEQRMSQYSKFRGGAGGGRTDTENTESNLISKYQMATIQSSRYEGSENEQHDGLKFIPKYPAHNSLDMDIEKQPATFGKGNSGMTTPLNAAQTNIELAR